MGFDICFSKVSLLDYSLNKETAINDRVEIGYFQDVNCLLNHFGYKNESEYLEIEKVQIEDLLIKTNELLQIYEKINAQLELYKHDLKSNEKQLEFCDAIFTIRDNEDKSNPWQNKIDNLFEPFETAAKEKLPITLDFFTKEDYLEYRLGSRDYRYWYAMGLLEIKSIFEKILNETDFDTEQVFMWCSL